MPLVKRYTPKGEKNLTSNSVPKVKRCKLTLPDGPVDPIKTLNQVTFLIYGENKIGKTSLCSQFEDPIFLMFEPGGKGLRVARVQCTSWDEFKEYVDLIVNGDKFSTVIIDTISLCYKACIDWVCTQEGVTDPAEIGWGKGWKQISDEFSKQIIKISSTDRGVVFITHAEQSEFEKRTGGKYNKTIPNMMKQAKTFIEGFVDVIGFYGYYGDERYLTILGSDELNAGNRLKYHFKTISGKAIHSVPMGDSEEEAYQNLVAAFNNEQEDPCVPEYNHSVGDTPIKRDKKRKV